MDKQAAYELGVQLALRDAGLVKESAMDPVVQKGIQKRRLMATDDKNPYAKNWSPNVPRTSTEKAYDRPSMTAGPPKMAPLGHASGGGTPGPYKGVSGG